MMSDRSDTIVYLAKELLNADMASISAPQTSTQAGVQMSFKVLCFSTCLAALGSSVITSWCDEQTRPISKYERTELEALVFYTAQLNGEAISDIRSDVNHTVGVSNFDDMTVRDFKAARDILRTRVRTK